ASGYLRYFIISRSPSNASFTNSSQLPPPSFILIGNEFKNSPNTRSPSLSSGRPFVATPLTTSPCPLNTPCTLICAANSTLFTGPPTRLPISFTPSNISSSISISFHVDPCLPSSASFPLLGSPTTSLPSIFSNQYLSLSSSLIASLSIPMYSRYFT